MLVTERYENQKFAGLNMVTFTNREECEHLNGWYVVMDVYFLWFFTVKKRIFVCSDCGYVRNA
jgi:hypothetical protein